MASPQDDHKNATEARAGATPHVGRYVLGFGLVGVILLFALLLFAFG